MMLKQMIRFGLVGTLATFVHMVIGSLLIASGWNPLYANLIAFATAFLVSFVGHLGYSFADQDANPARAFQRFAVVALIGFACNEALLLGLTTQGVFSNTVALWVSTGFAALFTFALSRRWAFHSAREISVDPFSARPGFNVTNR